MNLDSSEITRILADSTEAKTVAELEAQREFEIAKEALLTQFNNHNVTKELEGGVTAPNISGTLGGRGNLFTFIGFPENSQPTAVVRSILEHNIHFVPKGHRSSSRGVDFLFTVEIPEEEIYNSTPLPFESGNSWVRGIEQGISGFSHYVYLNKPALKSRSLRGLEIEGSIGGSFSPTPYVSALLNQFRERLRL